VNLRNNKVVRLPTGVFRYSHLLRKDRFSEPGHAYMVTTVTEGRARLFIDWRIGRAVARELVDAPVETLAWVLIPDHLHWLFVLGDEGLAVVVRTMKSRSARAVNHLLAHEGSMWQKGYHDHAIRREEDLCKLARYMVANPLRAGLVEKIRGIPFGMLFGCRWRVPSIR